MRGHSRFSTLMRYVLLTLFLALSSLAAPKRIQLTWQGYVSGSATLYIQGDRVDVQGRNTGAVDRPEYKFNAPLPAARQRVEVAVRSGQGSVEIVEQPTPDNQYSAVIQIEPRAQRTEKYVLDFRWDPAANRPSKK